MQQVGYGALTALHVATLAGHHEVSSSHPQLCIIKDFFTNVFLIFSTRLRIYSCSTALLSMFRMLCFLPRCTLLPTTATNRYASHTEHKELK